MCTVCEKCNSERVTITTQNKLKPYWKGEFECGHIDKKYISEITTFKERKANEKVEFSSLPLYYICWECGWYRVKKD